MGGTHSMGGARNKKQQREQLVSSLRGSGSSWVEVAEALRGQFRVNPRVAFRYAHGWSQSKAAEEWNKRSPDAMKTFKNFSHWESWPGPTGHAPSADNLTKLAELYECAVSDLLVDLPNFRHLDRVGSTPPAAGEKRLVRPEGCSLDRGTAVSAQDDRTGLIWGHRRLVRCDARGVPVLEEVIVAAGESAQFQRWSATTNVDDTVLEQMTADVAELAWREQIDPPATTYARLLGARDDVFRLIAGHQRPHHTTSLYKIASQVTAMLAMVTYDLGHPHAANTHARTALHCAEVSGHTPIRVFIRSVQSSIAISEGRYDEAAELMEAARPDATSGTTLLRLTSKLARINAARNRPDEVTRALALAETAPSERSADEPGVLGFDFAWAARTAGDAHYALGGAEHLDAAVDWARIALDARSAETQPKPTYIAGARFVLVHAYLGRGELEAVGEHLAPILRATDAEYRTVPIIGRARSLHTLLAQRTDLTSGTLTTLRDDLAGFITHPAPTPPQLESGTTT